MFCVDISCYCSIRWKITFKFKFNHKISENHKVTNYQNCSVMNYFCTTVTQIIQEVWHHRLTKNYIVTNCVKISVHICQNYSVKFSEPHCHKFSENYDVMTYEIYSVINYEKYNVTKYLRAVMLHIIWKLKYYELSELQCHDENFLPLGCSTTYLSKQSLNFWTNLSTIKGNSTIFLQNAGYHWHSHALSYLRRMQSLTTLLWKYQYSQCHTHLRTSMSHTTALSQMIWEVHHKLPDTYSVRNKTIFKKLWFSQRFAEESSILWCDTVSLNKLWRTVMPPCSGSRWPWTWRHYHPSKCQELLVKKHNITSQNTDIFKFVVILHHFHRRRN